MRITHEIDDFRKYEPVIAKNKSGKNIKMMAQKLDDRNEMASFKEM
jgi:hypothetical protein